MTTSQQASPPRLAEPLLARDAELVAALQQMQILTRHGASVERGLRTRDRWDDRWADALLPAFTPLAISDPGKLAKRALFERNRLEKGRVADYVFKAMRAVVKAAMVPLRDFRPGVAAIYMTLAHDMSEDAGQHTLDDLGLNQTFRWTGARDMPRDMFAVRGSKVIQQAYGDHIDRLTKIVLDATDPAAPKTQRQVQRAITEAYPRIAKSQVETISRTETAAVWETTRRNAMLANEVAWFDISIARGPSIGPPKSSPVCKVCLKAAADGPYPYVELPQVPLHPRCRCTTLPSLTRDWLPPAEPWHGNDPPLPVDPAPAP